MSLFIGIVLALMSAAICGLVKFDRRTFSATVLIVVASYYVLFAAVAGSMRAAMLESLMMTVFIGLAVVGFKRGSWVLALALGAHGVFDLLHGRILTNPGVPAWWPSFCMAYDVAIAVALTVLRTRAAAPQQLPSGVAVNPPLTSGLS